MRVTFIPFLFILPGVVCSSDWWMEEPYETDSFNVRCKYGENVSIPCQDHRKPSPEEIQYWILPDLTVMNRTDYNEFQTLDGPAGWYINSNGTSVEVFLVQERHFGFYYCVFYNSSTGGVEVVKKGLNYKGPYFGDLWPTYEKAVVIGSTAAGICIALFTVLCLIYEIKFHKEWEEEFDQAKIYQEEMEIAKDGQTATTNSAIYSNPGYADDVEGTQVTRRKTENGDQVHGIKFEDDDFTCL